MRLHRLDLNALLVFDALVEHRSVSKAAARLNVGQPALSAALARLREYFGDPLFVRSAGAMLPTELALSLAGPVRELLQQAETIAHTRASFDPASTARRFSIAVSDYTSTVLMPAVIALLAKEAPRVQLSLRATPTPVNAEDQPTTEALERRQYDFAVVPAGAHSERHRSEVLMVDDYRCIARIDHPTVRQAIGALQYRTSLHAVVELAEGRGSMMDTRALQQMGLTRRVGPVVERFNLLGDVVVSTDCIATVPARLAVLLAQRLPLQVLPMPIALPPLTELLQWKASQDADAGCVWLREVLHRAAGTEARRTVP